MRVIAGLWRWRRNPLCRKTDLAEAWLALTAILLIAVAAPVAGMVTGSSSRQALLRSMRDQQRQRHEIPATVLEALPQPPLDTDPETGTGTRRSRVLASWTGPDRSHHTGKVFSPLRTPHPGDHFTLWTDDRGKPVQRPLDRTTATAYATLAGIGAAALTALSVEGGRQLVRWRMVRRRYARWDRAWERAGPDWGRTGTGS
ncbi:hypothetical protein [Streptomyces sp. NPDC058045]|uniref:Rv1733c family protein n=1 Tax=Streptomyces sp. NPDC058045 TaxID=3346311 RepID=UPI0036E62156